jgi:amidohydrolase
MNILELVNANKASMLKHFKHLHTYPELSGKEHETIAYIAKELTALGINYTVVENGGILGFIEGKNSGKTVALRADVDALPIEEAESNGTRKRECISKNKGAMHACGHDGHTAMLLTAAKILNENRDQLNGRVILLFERGEEGTSNVILLNRHIAENKIRIDSIYAIHLYYDLETGKIAILTGPVNCCVVQLFVTIKGRGGHGSRPDQANSPIDCFVALYTALQSTRMKYVSPYLPVTLSIGSVHSGAVWNIIADELSFTGSYRFTNREGAEKMAEEVKRIVKHICAAYGCEADAEITAKGMPVVNDAQCADIARSSIGSAIGNDRVCVINPWMASDSFGLTSKIWPSIYALVGIKNPEKGTGKEHHNNAFEVDEDALTWGAASSVAYALGFLSGNIDSEGAIYKKPMRELYEKTGMTKMVVDMYADVGADTKGLDLSFV